MRYSVLNLSVAKFIKFIILGIFVSIILTFMISLVSIGDEKCKCHGDINNNKNTQFKNGHKLAIIVPFRDRFDELLKFVPHMHKFLSKQKINFNIFIINQADSFRFNRASLINVGFLISQNIPYDKYDYIAMHDVDLLPINHELSYSYPSDGPVHLASPELHPKYHYKTFVGGILLIAKKHFELVNGLSNKYWGWGLEDDEFYARLKEAGFNINRPKGITTGINNTFIHIHDRSIRKRDTARLFNQKEVTRKRDRQTGLNTVQYDIIGVNDLTIDNYPFKVYHIKLICDVELTPWCDIKLAKNKVRTS